MLGDGNLVRSRAQSRKPSKKLRAKNIIEKSFRLTHPRYGYRKMNCPDISIVQKLDNLSIEPLRNIWQTYYGAPPPLRSPELLRLMLAWRMQASIQGGLEPSTRKQLARTAVPTPEGLSLGIGTKLGRIWKGQRVEVEITEQGFLHDGEIYRSLSAAATAIAGTRWNGPKFFGLREPKT